MGPEGGGDKGRGKRELDSGKCGMIQEGSITPDYFTDLAECRRIWHPKGLRGSKEERGEPQKGPSVTNDVTATQTPN